MLAKGCSRRFGRTLVFSLVACAASRLAQPAAGRLEGVRGSWLGNTYPFGGGPGLPYRWVPQDVEDIAVAPDGTVYTNVFWEEGGANQCEIKDGKVVNRAGGSRGWGHEGGACVAVNSKYVYYAQRYDNEGGGLRDPQNWPPKGFHWHGVSRRNRSDIRTGDPFEGGKGGKECPRGCFLVVHEAPVSDDVRIAGLCATDQELFVSCPYDSKMRVYDANTMRLVRTWPLECGSDIAVDRQGMLWVVRGREGRYISRYDPNGTKLPQEVVLPEPSRASDICVDRSNRLLVADAGPDHQLRIYDRIDTAPVLAATFGRKGGIFSGRRGEFGELRFHSITGVGSDDAGNIYVASTQRPASGGGCILESYTAAGRLNWRVMALEFVDRAAEDPGEPTSLYTKDTRYKMDYRKPPGEEWSYAAYTLDWHRYPHDPRLTLGLLSPFVQRLEGRRFLFLNGQNGATPFGVWRFDPAKEGEIAIPCVLYSHRHAGNVPNEPAAGEWLWRDEDGDGQFDPDEFLTRNGQDGPGAGGIWVDSSLTVWLACGDIRSFVCRGLNRAGVPLYDFESSETVRRPEPFQEVKRIRYDPQADVMYLGGTTREHRNVHWKGMGPVLCRYDGWSKGGRTPRWQIVGTYDRDYRGGHESCEPLSFDVAGEYVFVALAGGSGKLAVGWGHIDVYRADTGEHVGFIEPPKEFGQVGLMDMVECLRAFRLPWGEYVIIEEEDYAAKNLLHLWRPAAK